MTLPLWFNAAVIIFAIELIVCELIALKHIRKHIRRRQMTDYSNLTDSKLFDAGVHEWPYSKRDGLVTLYCTQEIPDDEALAYINRGRDMFNTLRTIFVVIDGDHAMIEHCYGKQDFDRIRRVTGYLSGTLDRFNDAKKAEVSERVKHKVKR